MTPPLHIAFTTVGMAEQAKRLAGDAVNQHLAVCAQIDGPITSIYHWQGKCMSDQEFRISFKVLPAKLADLETWVLAHHPYETPEWIVLGAEKVAEKYLSWAIATSTPAPS